MSLTAPQRETVITFSDEHETATIHTHQRRIITKLRNNPAATEIEDRSAGVGPPSHAALRLRGRCNRFGQQRQARVEAGKAKHARDLVSTTSDSQLISVGCRPAGSMDQYGETSGVDKCQLAQVHHDLLGVSLLCFQQSRLELGARVQIELTLEADDVFAGGAAGVNLENKVLLEHRDPLDGFNVRKSGGDTMFRK